jgi:hypothetical protein
MDFNCGIIIVVGWFSGETEILSLRLLTCQIYDIPERTPKESLKEKWKQALQIGID